MTAPTVVFPSLAPDAIQDYLPHYTWLLHQMPVYVQLMEAKDYQQASDLASSMFDEIATLLSITNRLYLREGIFHGSNEIPSRGGSSSTFGTQRSFEAEAKEALARAIREGADKYREERKRAASEAADSKRRENLDSSTSTTTSEHPRGS